MANEDHRPAFVKRGVFHLGQAFLLKLGIADGKHLVDEKNLGIEMGRDGKGEPDVHAARIAFDRCVEKSFDLGEGDDLVEFLFNFGARHAEYRAIQKNVLSTGQLGMEAGPDFEKCPDSAVDVDAARGWFSNPV